jgi:hypothetical protein
MSTLKIISGYSERGGSTTVFITLTNIFNKNGINCIFYGPHTWHLDKCRAGLIQDATFAKEDTFITHFVKLKQRPDVKRVVYACHEKGLINFDRIKKHWDEVVFINENHRLFHSNYTGPYSIVPNAKEDLRPNDKSGLDNIAAVIGTVDFNKQTHISIERALKNNCKEVHIYGTVTDFSYYKKYVEPLLRDTRVQYKGYENNKQLIYDRVGRVYHSSISESDGLVRYECYQTNTKYFGTSATSHPMSTLTNTEIFSLWKKVLQL